MSRKKFLRLPWWEYVVIGILAALCVLPILVDAYSSMTCGASDEELLMYLKPRMAPEATGLLKVEQNGRIKAAIYEHKSLGLAITVFERRLFGLRWKQHGMDGLGDPGLHNTGAWSSGGNCHVIIYGDNRDGLVRGYTLPDCPEVARDGLESDFILDIYILDGIDAYPMELEQYAVPRSFVELDKSDDFEKVIVQTDEMCTFEVDIAAFEKETVVYEGEDGTIFLTGIKETSSNAVELQFKAQGNIRADRSTIMTACAYNDNRFVRSSLMIRPSENVVAFVPSGGSILAKYSLMTAEFEEFGNCFSLLIWGENCDLNQCNVLELTLRDLVLIEFCRD